jgi:hypothetical protein
MLFRCGAKIGPTCHFKKIFTSISARMVAMSLHILVRCDGTSLARKLASAGGIRIELDAVKLISIFTLFLKVSDPASFKLTLFYEIGLSKGIHFCNIHHGACCIPWKQIDIVGSNIQRMQSCYLSLKL